MRRATGARWECMGQACCRMLAAWCNKVSKFTLGWHAVACDGGGGGAGADPACAGTCSADVIKCARQCMFVVCVPRFFCVPVSKRGGACVRAQQCSTAPLCAHIQKAHQPNDLQLVNSRVQPLPVADVFPRDCWSSAAVPANRLGAFSACLWAAHRQVPSQVSARTGSRHHVCDAHHRTSL